MSRNLSLRWFFNFLCSFYFLSQTRVKVRDGVAVAGNSAGRLDFLVAVECAFELLGVVIVMVVRLEVSANVEGGTTFI